MPEGSAVALVVANEYTITLNNLISGMSASAIQVAKTTTTSDVVVSLPADVQLSSSPLAGKYRIKCVYKDSTFEYTSELALNTPDWQVANAIWKCKGMYDRVEVKDLKLFPSPNNGISLRLRFRGVVDDVGQFEIVSGVTTPLTGGTISYAGTTVMEAGCSLFYDPIPFEFFKTYETSP